MKTLVMVIQRRADVIGFVRDDDTWLAFNLDGTPNWYHSIIASPMLRLVVPGRSIEGAGEPIASVTALPRVIEVYQQQRPNVVHRFFSIPADAPLEQIVEHTGKHTCVVRFHAAPRYLCRYRGAAWNWSRNWAPEVYRLNTACCVGQDVRQCQ